MRHTTHREKDDMLVSAKSSFVTLLVATLLSAFGVAWGCGVQEGQEQIENARQVEKQVEDSQRGLEKKLQEQGKEDR